MSAIRDKLLGVLNPNALLKRTVWSSPQGTGAVGRKRHCASCKHWVATYPDARYDPADQKTYEAISTGQCSNLRIMAAYEKPPTMRSYYCCSYWKAKEKENGKA